jgi:transposase InsO family protein
VKYAFVDKERAKHTVKTLCRVLEVSASGYYKWRQGAPTPRQERRTKLLQRILEIFEESRQTYGCPRVYKQLRSEGFRCNKKLVEELMRKNEISPKRKRKYKATTDSKHDLPIAPNVLSREFTVEEPDEVWVSDITYVETAQGWLYLCVFIDLYSRMVVGWSMSSNMTAAFVVDAFNMGISKRGRAPIVVHSDRGSQYASELFRGLIDLHDCIQSMSRRGNCWDNAVAESFFGTLKQELIYQNHYTSRIQATMSIFDYIEIFYNKQRLHSVLGFLTPEEKEQQSKKVA